MKKILLVEDDLIMQETVQKCLNKDYEIVTCATLAAAADVLAGDSSIALAIVDRGLPDGDGLSLVSDIRRDSRISTIPLIFLSGRDSESDKVSGFFAGADDYVTKPFSVLELRARVMARLRTTSSSKIAKGNLEIDLDSHRAFSLTNGARTEIELTRIELKLLVVFIHGMGRVLSRDSLLEKVWGVGCHVSDRVIDSHVSHLRRKISGNGLSLRSLRGEGYRLDEEAAVLQAA